MLYLYFLICFVVGIYGFYSTESPTKFQKLCKAVMYSILTAILILTIFVFYSLFVGLIL